SAGGRGDAWFESNIPSGRGLGFSGAAIVAGTIVGMISRESVRALDVDAFIEHHREEILDRAATIEGHPDNVAASLYGGVIAVAGRTVIDLPVGFDARLAVWVPSSSTSTAKSRATLGGTVDRDDAVFNLGRVLLLAQGLRSGDRRLLRLGTRDRLHQEARLAAAPRSRDALLAFEECGAIAVWLSGSGPSVAALSTVVESSVVVEKVREVMGNDDGRVLELAIDASGARHAT
ncbi:MAG: homoserine kinase, partial [Actinomycetota bacterium]